MPRLAARKDKNHDIIKEAVQAAGYWWCDTYQLGNGYPDANVLSKAHRLLLVEVKSEDGELTEKEKAFHASCPVMIEIWRTPEEALERLFDYWDEED